MNIVVGIGGGITQPVSARQQTTQAVIGENGRGAFCVDLLFCIDAADKLPSLVIHVLDDLRCGIADASTHCVHRGVMRFRI